MNGGNLRAVNQQRLRPQAVIFGAAGRALAQALHNPRAHFRSGGIGEGEHEQAIDVAALCGRCIGHEIRAARRKNGRLARAGGRGDDNAAVDRDHRLSLFRGKIRTRHGR